MTCRATSIKVLSVALAIVILAGCQSDETESPPQTNSGATATLILETAQITYPLDAFGMTIEEKQIVRAAQAAIIWQCAEETQTLSKDAVDNVHQWLTWVDTDPSWAYGFWNAKYIAANGIFPEMEWPIIGPDILSMPELAEKSRNCFLGEEYNSISIVDTVTVTGDGSLETAKLGIFSSQAGEQTQSDPTFLALIEKRRHCVEEQGYKTYDSSETALGNIYIDPSWSEEQTLEAYLVEAKCDDDMGLTQQAANIDASYEQRLIDENKAELLEIKNIADKRVVKATKILEDLGIL